MLFRVTFETKRYSKAKRMKKDTYQILTKRNVNKITFKKKSTIRDKEGHSAMIRGIICLMYAQQQSLKIFKAKIDQITRNRQIHNDRGRFNSLLCNIRKGRLKIILDLKPWLTSLI